MAKYKIIFDCEEQDEVFSTEEAAEEYALYLCSCTREGAEILHMSNPGDYDYDEDSFEDPEYEIEQRIFAARKNAFGGTKTIEESK